jgi:predicted RNase H-like HicB family nuclease
MKITRREFIKKTSITALSTNLVASNILANAPEKEKNVAKTNEGNKKMITKQMELVSYCGGYCGRCGICELNIQTGIKAIQNVTEAAGILTEAEHLGWPLMRDIATDCCKQFENNLSSFANLSSKLFPTNCRGGCVPCDIAKCCKDKGFFTCAECSEMEKCSKLGKQYEKVSKNLMEIKRIGSESWAKNQYEEIVQEKRQKLIQAVNKAFEQS